MTAQMFADALAGFVRGRVHALTEFALGLMDRPIRALYMLMRSRGW